VRGPFHSYKQVSLTMGTGDILFNTSILVGYGSIGIKHANFLKSCSSKLVIIDPKFSSNKPLLDQQQNTNIIQLENWNSTRFNLNEQDVVVVANWGPDHSQSVEDAISIGAKQIVLEKPCVDSLEEIDKLIEIAFKFQVKVVVNQGDFYLDLGNRINQLGHELGLGSVVAIWVTGGARCLSTAGSHWISLANQIFMDNPIFIFGDAKNNFINPRSDNLSFYDGIFSFTYPGNRRLGINLTNNSSIKGRFEIYWKHAVGELYESELTIKRVEQTNTKITLYQEPTKMIFSGPVPWYKEGALKADSLEVLYKSLLESDFKEVASNLRKHLDVTKATLLALISSEKQVRLDFDEKLESTYFCKKYNIS